MICCKAVLVVVVVGAVNAPEQFSVQAGGGGAGGIWTSPAATDRHTNRARATALKVLRIGRISLLSD